MNDPHGNAITDREALIDAMARVWAETRGETWPAAGARCDSVRELMRGLFYGQVGAESAADRAALALLQHRDDGDPVTAADREAQAVCPTCNGAKVVPCGPDCTADDDGDCERCGGLADLICPDAPDGCGGTGKRGGK